MVVEAMKLDEVSQKWGWGGADRREEAEACALLLPTFSTPGGDRRATKED